MIVERQDVRYRSKCFSEMWLIKMTCVVVEVSMSDLFLGLGRPWRVPPVVFATQSRPMPQGRYILPQSIGHDLIASSDLDVKTSHFLVLLQHIFPHRT